MKLRLLPFLLLLAVPAFSQKIGVLNGPSGIPCGYLMEQAEQKNNSWEFEKFANAQALLPKLLKGEIDIGFLPPNAAAKVYNSSGKKIISLGIAGNGNLFLMTTDGNCQNISDLSGKTVVCAGMGATPEYLFRYLLKKNDVENVDLNFSVPNPDIAAGLAAGKYDCALVPEPFATVAEIKGKNVNRIDIQKIFSASTDIQNYPMTLLVCNADWAKKHKKEIQVFLKAYEKAGSWTVANPDKAGELSEKYELGLTSQVVKKSVPNSAYTWKPAKAGKKEVESLLGIFLNFAPESIGGKLPDEGFYY